MQAEQTGLFDADEFDSALAGNNEPLALFKSALKNAKSALKQKFEQGDDTARLVFQYTLVVDQLLVRAYSLFIKKQDAALVAVGGYGRGELHPASDTDILILMPNDDQATISHDVENLLTFLWDIGLEVGHSVRTVEECALEARQDITVITNLVESRLINGPDVLFSQMQSAIAPDRIWSSRAFFEAKLEEQNTRHQKFFGTAYNLEPNVKDGPGGLRDIHTISWVTRRHFGSATLHELVNKNFLSEAEYNALIDGQNFIWKVRFGLHIITGRHEDRLLFDYQRTLAKQFGYKDNDNRLAVEQFMKQYYCNIMELSRLNEMLLQLFQEAILHSNDDDKPVFINKRFQSINGYVEVTGPDVFKKTPSALLEIFLILAKHPEYKGVRASTIRLIRDHRYLIDDNFRNDMRCRGLFMKFFRQAKGITHELRRMNRYGILAEYLPVFKNIVGQMQHDLFHHYTVDEHTIFVIRNLRRFTVPEFFHEFPLASNIIQRIPKLEILYIAGFFHDIAKGRGGNHSELGAHDAITFCQHHGLRQYDTKLVAWLIKSHLIMSTTAQRKDISDPEVINAFARLVGNQVQLDHLYLLTVADMRATNPTLWNSWKDSLLTELYMSTTRVLRQDANNQEHELNQTNEIKISAQHILEQHSGLNFGKINKLWETFGDDYFSRHSAERIAWHTEAILKNENCDLPLTIVYPEDEVREGYLEIFVYTQDHDNIFSTITSALDQLGLNIVDARIITALNGYTLDTYIVLEESDNQTDRQTRVHEIIQGVNNRLSQLDSLAKPVHRRLPRQLKHFPITTQVNFRPDPNCPRTIMEVIASDRPGLLSQIGAALMTCQIRLQNAKIATFGERAEDIFFITDKNNLPINDEKQQKCLCDSIKNALNNQ